MLVLLVIAFIRLIRSGIFQDDRPDIRNAASSMPEVYSRSVCDISALNARQDGTFSTRHLEAVGQHAISVCKLVADTRHCYLIESLSQWAVEMNNVPLTHRGWVAQEQVLPPRTLYCGGRQLFWACPTSRGAESDIRNLTDSIDVAQSYEAYKTTISRVQHVLADPSQAASDNVIELWDDFISQYSTFELTVASDKLVAIAGVAKMYSSLLGDDYLAGHLRKRLIGSLL